MPKKKLAPLTPPDRERCQAEVHSYNAWVMGGSCHEVKRCEAKPTVIAKETKPAPDGRRGSMSLCGKCFGAMVEKLGPDFATSTKIRRRK